MTNQPKLGQFCWTELAASNVQAAKNFYGKVFGWKFREDNIGGMPYTMFKAGEGNEIGGIWKIPEGQEKEIPPHWMSYILVENLEESIDKAVKNGAIIIKPAMNVGDFGRMAIIRDPVGAHIALWQPLKM